MARTCVFSFLLSFPPKDKFFCLLRFKKWKKKKNYTKKKKNIGPCGRHYFLLHSKSFNVDISFGLITWVIIFDGNRVKVGVVGSVLLLLLLLLGSRCNGSPICGNRCTVSWWSLSALVCDKPPMAVTDDASLADLPISHSYYISTPPTNKSPSVYANSLAQNQ